MNKRLIAILSLAAVTVAVAATSLDALADKWRQKYGSPPLEPTVSVYSRALIESPSTTGTIQVLDRHTNVIRDLVGSDLPAENFVVTKTITSAAAVTAINVIPDSQVPAGRKVYITGFHAKVSGATNWATTATVKIQDTSAVDYFTMAVAALTGNAEVRPGVTNITSENAYLLGTGGTAAKGIQLKGNANGTGSDLVVTIYGQIR